MRNFTIKYVVNICKRIFLLFLLIKITTLTAIGQTKVACIGNSITEYSGYPAKLGTLLGSGYAVTNLGTSGTTLRTWARYTELFALNPTIITIKLGSNDSYEPNWMADGQAGYIARYNKLLDSIFHNISPAPLVYLCLPTPRIGTAGSILENELLHCIKVVAQARNLPIIDTHFPLVSHMDYFGDGLHPNSQGADSIAAIISRAIIGNNLVPSAVITSPIFNSNVDPSSEVTINLNATDIDGTIARVEFYDGTTFLGEDNTFPYSFVLTNITSGDHDIIAYAIDNNGAINKDLVHVFAIKYINTCDSVKRRYWLNLGGGSSVTTIDTSIAPSGINYMKNIFKGMLNGGNTASYMNGYVCPPSTGNYIFWICSTDDGEFWLSTNDLPANKQRRSFITSQYATENDFSRNATQKSVSIALEAGKKYYYEVRTKGGCCGNWIQLTWQLPNNSFENPIPVYRFSTTSTLVSADNVAPTAPTALVSSAIASASFTLNWTASIDNVGVVSYEVFRGTTSCGTTSSTSLNITGLTPSIAYSITVKAKDAAGNVSVASTALSVTTTADTEAPTAPTGLVSSALAQTSFTLSWTASTDNVGVVSYEVFRGAISCGTSTSTTLNIIGLAAASVYNITVIAKDTAGNISDASNELIVTTISTSLKTVEAEIEVYPNPSINILNISNIESESLISVYDLNGILKLQKKAENNLIQIDVSMLSTGIYIIKISFDSGVVIEKFVKE